MPRSGFARSNAPAPAPTHLPSYVGCCPPARAAPALAPALVGDSPPPPLCVLGPAFCALGALGGGGGHSRNSMQRGVPPEMEGTWRQGAEISCNFRFHYVYSFLCCTYLFLFFQARPIVVTCRGTERACKKPAVPCNQEQSRRPLTSPAPQLPRPRRTQNKYPKACNKSPKFEIKASACSLPLRPAPQIPQPAFHKHDIQTIFSKECNN